MVFGEVPGGGSEATGEVPGGHWLTVAEVGTLIGMSERSARDWVKRRDLPVSDSRPLRVEEAAVRAQLAREHRQARTSPEVAGEVPGGPPEAPGGVPEPIEVAYRVAPAAIERAIERTGEKYVADFAKLYERITTELGAVYQGQLAAKDQVIATQGETIAELRRRAEVAEAERDRLTAAQAAQDGPGASGGASADKPTPEPSARLWARLRRVFGR